MFRGLSGLEFLREWHAHHPGKSGAVFSDGRIVDDGRSSYALLVDDVAALPDAHIVLDLACGDGYLLELLADRLPSAELIGVDVTPQELELARKRGLPKRVRTVEARAGELPLDDASIDAAVCHMALMLFDDAAAVVGELTRVIRPGGSFSAVLGPAPGSNELAARLRDLIAEAEAADELPPLTAGDPRTFKEESLRALFASDAWHDPQIEDFRLAIDGPDDQALTGMLGMYQVARLSAESQSNLREQLADELTTRRATNQPTDFVVGLRHLKILRSFTSRSVS
jgi:SAM-dependent methyltransferase